MQPKNIPMKYEELSIGVSTGKIRIPKFQREFVWSLEQTAKLIDSIIKGFPIGTFIFWETSDSMRTIRSIGNEELPPTREGQPYLYVLDGQQRITSLFAVQKGVRFDSDGKHMDYSGICINLDVDPDADEEIVLIEIPQSATTISVYDLLNGKVGELARRFPQEEHLDRIDTYRTRLTGYDFSTILMERYPIEIACEVFTRINTGGTDLTLFEIMVAKTFDVDREFDLAHEYQWLIDNDEPGDKDLSDAHFETLPPSTVLQCIAADLAQMVRRQDILRLDKASVIDRWSAVKEGIFSAVDYLRSSFRIPVSQLLPYNALIVPLAYFFIRNEFKPPNALQSSYLHRYFWWASLSGRFSSAVDGKLALDIKRMEDVLCEIEPDYRGEELRLTAEDIKWRWFSASDAVCKAILCLYAFHEPISFLNNDKVRIDNSWLRRANSKNYHHFFPKSYLRKQGLEEWQANTIINITIVDDYLNKRSISSRPPSRYLKEFKKKNPNLDSAMPSHLIGDLDSWGVWEDNYEEFITQRSERVFQELKARLGSLLKQEEPN